MIAAHEAEVASRFDALRERFKTAIEPDDYRLRGVLDALGPVAGLRVLDLGCGKGRFARRLEELGARVVGLDLSSAMLAEAEGIDRVRASARRLPFAAASFHAVMAVEVFEHLDPKTWPEAIAEARRVLAPGGTLVVVDKSPASCSAQRPWLPSALVKWIDERRGLWMYPPGGPVRERWLWPGGFRRALLRSFDEARVVHLISPAEERRWLFRRVPRARLMTLWAARRSVFLERPAPIILLPLGEGGRSPDEGHGISDMARRIDSRKPNSPRNPTSLTRSFGPPSPRERRRNNFPEWNHRDTEDTEREFRRENSSIAMPRRVGSFPGLSVSSVSLWFPVFFPWFRQVISASFRGRGGIPFGRRVCKLSPTASAQAGEGGADV